MAEQTPAVGMQRKLAAIFSTDVVGYSRLMGDDEEATIHTLTAYRAVITSLIQHYRGRVVDSPGDNLLAEFASVVDAVRCAVEIQHALTVKNAELPEHRQMRFRIGINLGDVIIEGERLYGDGVNIAARLESLAHPGGICISGKVFEEVEQKLPFTYEYQGEQTVKNIAKPVRVYRVGLEAADTQPALDKEHQTPSEKQSWHVRPMSRWIASGVALLVVTCCIWWYGSRPPLNSRSSPSATQEARLPSLPLPDKPSLVVLPFVNMSEDPRQDYFSDGLTDVLTGDLSKISSLFVIARNSAFTYKGKAVNVQDIRKELGVRYVLEGSVQKANDQVRIVTQLIDTTTDSHLWSERYDRPLKDIFALQDEIVQKIATTLNLQLTLLEQGILARKTTENLEAYDYYLRGLAAFTRFTKDTNAQARQLFEQAIALDPRYAAAYEGLGSTYYIPWIWRWSRDVQTLEQALELAQRAVSLNDTLPQAHGLLSLVYAQQQQYDRALAEAERTIALDPNNANGYAEQAEVLNYAGRPEEALREVEQAMRLNPHYPAWYLFESGWAYRLTGRYEEAIAVLKALLQRNPDFLTAYLNLAVCYRAQWAFQMSADPRTLEYAMEAAQRTIALNTEPASLTHAIQGYVYLWQKQYEPALVELERVVSADTTFATGYALLAEALSYAGKPQEALRVVAQATHLGPPPGADSYFYSIGTAYYLAGRTEEAVATFKRMLTQYPDHL